MPGSSLLIDDVTIDGRLSALNTAWTATTDRVMGGLSDASLARETAHDRAWLWLRGAVRLENGGGFVQMGLDLAEDGGRLDLGAYERFRLLVVGNGAAYGLHLRTDDCERPWESYRATFVAPKAPAWVEIGFDDLTPHRLDARLDTTRARRLSLIAIGRAFEAGLGLGRIEAERRPTA